MEQHSEGRRHKRCLAGQDFGLVRLTLLSPEGVTFPVKLLDIGLSGLRVELGDMSSMAKKPALRTGDVLHVEACHSQDLYKALSDLDLTVIWVRGNTMGLNFEEDQDPVCEPPAECP